AAICGPVTSSGRLSPAAASSSGTRSTAPAPHRHCRCRQRSSRSASAIPACTLRQYIVCTIMPPSFACILPACIFPSAMPLLPAGAASGAVFAHQVNAAQADHGNEIFDQQIAHEHGADRRRIILTAKGDEKED